MTGLSRHTVDLHRRRRPPLEPPRRGEASPEVGPPQAAADGRKSQISVRQVAGPTGHILALFYLKFLQHLPLAHTNNFRVGDFVQFFSDLREKIHLCLLLRFISFAVDLRFRRIRATLDAEFFVEGR